ncbi:hypothetical protein PL9214650303 [Planktothrix tepida PCC 9214]|uniref:Uncharacterized protein n=1 Tax=Planktothrix tepida PCC 9214 TaxID=671072 RepID=A0A1J1LQK4_9CYAN|nr:hypothetical protein PL9214650303 [Planktothrix tepida PCC 9214]
MFYLLKYYILVLSLGLRIFLEFSHRSLSIFSLSLVKIFCITYTQTLIYGWKPDFI